MVLRTYSRGEGGAAAEVEAAEPATGWANLRRGLMLTVLGVANIGSIYLSRANFSHVHHRVLPSRRIRRRPNRCRHHAPRRPSSAGPNGTSINVDSYTPPTGSRYPR